MATELRNHRNFKNVTITDESYSWWVKPISIFYRGHNYMTSVALNSDLMIRKINGSGEVVSEAVVSSELQTDEHNSPAFTFINDQILIAYSGRNSPNVEFLKMDLNLNVIQPVQTIITASAMNYIQFLSYENTVLLLSRADIQNWDVSISNNSGTSFGNFQRLFTNTSSVGSQLYISSQHINRTTACIGIYNHPNTVGNTLYQAEININTGNVSSSGVDIMNLYSSFSTIDVGTLTSVKTVSNDDRFRFLDITGNNTHTYYLVADFLSTESADYRSGDYKLIVLEHSTWSINEYNIVAHGKDGYITYFGGAYFQQDILGDWKTNFNRIYLTREASEIWYLESYRFIGSNFLFESQIDVLPSGDTGNAGLSLHRPQPPYNSRSGGASVIYQSGNYFESFIDWDNELKLIKR